MSLPGHVLYERRRQIADHRKSYPAECAGLTDHQVEALIYCLEDVSSEALVAALHQRGYAVVLEVGG